VLHRKWIPFMTMVRVAEKLLKFKGNVNGYMFLEHR